MKTKITCILVALIAVTVLGSGAAFAKRSFMSRLDRIEGIDLTREQRVKLEAAEVAHRKKMIRFRADLSIAELEEHTLLKEKDFKKEAAREQIKKIMAIKTDMEMARLDNHDLIRRVLTDDQWNLFKEQLPKNRGGRKGKKHLGKGRHHGKMKGDCPFGCPKREVVEG